MTSKPLLSPPQGTAYWRPPAPPTPARRRHRRWPTITLVLWTALFALWMVAVVNAEPEKTGDPYYDAGAELGNDIGQALWGTVGVFVWLIGLIIILLTALVTRRRTS